jgi:hypothetical protein
LASHYGWFTHRHTVVRDGFGSRTDDPITQLGNKTEVFVMILFAFPPLFYTWQVDKQFGCVVSKYYSVRRVANCTYRGNALTMTKQVHPSTNVWQINQSWEQYSNKSLVVQCTIIGAFVKYEICGDVALMLNGLGHSCGLGVY